MTRLGLISLISQAGLLRETAVSYSSFRSRAIRLG